MERTFTRLTPFPCTELKFRLKQLSVKRMQDLKNNFQERSSHVFPLSPLSAKPTKWSNSLKQFIGNGERIV